MLRTNEIFIIGGGPSLKDFDFNLLKDKETIAVNMSALDVPCPTYSITADSSIFRKLCKGDFCGVSTTWVVVSNPNHCSMKFRNGRFQHNNGYVYNPFAAHMLIRNAGVEGIGFSFNDFRTGYNSGFCAFQLAVLLGYQKIYLLGFDLQGTHYHSYYGNRKISDNDFTRYFQNFIDAFSIIKMRADIEVISCSPISSLNKDIKYKSVKELL